MDYFSADISISCIGFAFLQSLAHLKGWMSLFCEMLLFTGAGTAQTVQYPENCNAGNKEKKLFSGSSVCI
jgi:hypothetical protein